MIQFLSGSFFTQEFYSYEYELYYVTPVKNLYRTKSVPVCIMTALSFVIKGNTKPQAWMFPASGSLLNPIGLPWGNTSSEQKQHISGNCYICSQRMSWGQVVSEVCPSSLPASRSPSLNSRYPAGWRSWSARLRAWRSPCPAGSPLSESAARCQSCCSRDHRKYVSRCLWGREVDHWQEVKRGSLWRHQPQFSGLHLHYI